MILLIDTTHDIELQAQLSVLMEEKDLRFEIADTDGMKISHCIGCNYCWLKTPGICTVKDDYEEILKKMVKADQIWIISGTALGFVTPQAKNIIDRVMPLATMYLKYEGKQMRHVLRYGKYDFGLIYCGEADREYLKKWSDRVAINFGGRTRGAFTKDEIEEVAACMS